MPSARILLALSVLTVAGCPAPTPTDPDAGGTDAPPVDAPLVLCTSDAECDDGLFCSGEEHCVGGRCMRTPVDCDDGVACTTDRCSEERVRCVHDAPDADGDGYVSAACVDGAGEPLGNDCDDADGNRYPGNREVCDDHDEDCDDTTLGGTDEDGDGFVSDACCNGTTCGDDCDDARDSSYPGGTEVCDGLDQNCDGTADDGVALDGFADRDRDLWGDSSMPRSACAGTAGWVPADRGGDCNDDPDSPESRRQNPGQPEICDGIRNDCDASRLPDEGAGAVNWYGDSDGDGFGSAATSVTVSCTVVPNASLLSTDCDDTSAPAVNPAAAEACNGVDDDCNGVPDFRIGDNDFEDDDGDGLLDSACTGGTDCNDRDAASGPGEIERCDGRDNDCDTIVDEGATSVVYYRDLDTDGYGSPASGSIVACMPSPGFVARAGDCNDADPGRYPGATEACNAADEDCDAAIDEAPAQSTCSVAHATTSVCVSGRCDVGECETRWDDCNGRAADGCEVSIDDDEANCGACGTVCASGETCAFGACSCNYDAVRCPGGCIDPLRDERFCGASGTCSGINAGIACVVGDVCISGRCTPLSQIFPGAVAGLSGSMPRGVTYTIDTAGPAVVEYTLDGTTPGSSPTTVTAPSPVTVVVDGGGAPVRIRWRAIYGTPPAVEIEPIQQYTHRTVGGADNLGNIAEHVDLNGEGPIARVLPGGSVSVAMDIQHWKSNGAGYCPGCVVYTSVNVASVGIAYCVGNTYLEYPGHVETGVSFSFTAPAAPGRYPVYASMALDFLCRDGGGTIIGYVVVDPPPP